MAEFLDTAAKECNNEGSLIDNTANDAIEEPPNAPDNYEPDFIDDTEVEEEYIPFNLGNSPSKLALPSPKKKMRIPAEIEEELNLAAGVDTQEMLDEADINDFSIDVLLRDLETEGIQFRNWTRQIKSDLTQIDCWFIAGLEHEPHPKGKAILQALENRQILIKTKFCTDFFLFCIEYVEGRRSRAGIKKMCENVSLQCVLIEAPNNRSTNIANLVKISLRDHKEGQEQMKWIKAIILDPMENKFDLSTMVQWAITNKIYTQAEITYNYVLLAGTGDNNAKNWLASTSQVKYAKDCSTQVKLINTGELICTPTKDVVSQQCADLIRKHPEADPGKVNLWCYLQDINIFDLQTALKHVIRGTMKKSVICFSGVQNSGKSTFVNYILQLFKGRFISFTPTPSSFWLQPAVGLKLVAVDDVPFDFWAYADSHLRPAFDGTQITIDIKYQAPHTGRLPPMLITTNLDIPKDERMKYLLNRIKFFDCPKSLLDSNRLAQFAFGVEDLAAWFKFWKENLDLEFEDTDTEDD